MNCAALFFFFFLFFKLPLFSSLLGVVWCEYDARVPSFVGCGNVIVPWPKSKIEQIEKEIMFMRVCVLLGE